MNFDFLRKETYIADDLTVLPYRIFIPEDIAEGKLCPLYIHMHGAGERGDDNEAQLITGNELLTAAAKNDDTPCFILAPQCSCDHKWVNTPWEQGSYELDKVEESSDMKAVIELIKKLLKEFPIDSKRVYVGGLSMGGYATWYMLMKYPEMFAAGVPVCGGGDPSKAEAIKDIAIRTFHSSDDPVVPVSGTRDMVNALKSVGGNVEYTEYDDLSHGCWQAAFTSDGILEWLLSQSK